MKQLNKQLRKELSKLSSKEVIERSGLYPVQVSNWRNGYDFKTIPLLRKLAQVIGKDIYLDGFTENIEERILNIIVFETQNLSTHNLSIMTGMHKNTFINMRLGKVPQLSTMLLIADKFNADINFVLI
jgi:hypothetical protein